MKNEGNGSQIKEKKLGLIDFLESIERVAAREEILVSQDVAGHVEGLQVPRELVVVAVLVEVALEKVLLLFKCLSTSYSLVSSRQTTFLGFIKGLIILAAGSQPLAG